MSYDFELYARSPASLPRPPETNAGHISCDGPDKVEKEDIPSSFLGLVAKKQWLYRIHVQGEIGAEDRLNVNRWLRDVIAMSKGVLIDLQTRTYETVTKSGELAPERCGPDNFGSMSFYFVDGEAFYERGLAAMFKTLADQLPAAMPTRYGYYEPLQGKIRQGEYAEILSAFQNDTDLFLRSPPPFGHIFLSVPCKKTFERWHPRHFIRRHHLFARVEFELRPKVFSTLATCSAVLHLFKSLCAQLNVVYAEILQTEEESGRGWFWYGLPDRKQVHTICIGPTYQSVWPEASVGGEQIGDRLRVFTSDRFGNKPPRPPAELVAPDRPFDPLAMPTRAPIFPFDYEFDYERYIW